MLERVKLFSRNDVLVRSDPGRSSPDEPLLRATILWIEVGLKLQGVPVVLTVADACDPRLDPMLEARTFRTIP